MVNDTPTPPKYAKVLTINNFKNLMAVTLDADKLNYSNWSALFKIHIRGCNALEFIQPPDQSNSEPPPPPPPSDEWLTVDSIIQSWILTTISESLMERVLKTKPKTAKDIWDALEKIFTDNKRSKTVELVGELRNLDIGDLTVDAYFRKVDSLASRLDNLGSNITEDDLVTYALNGLSDKFEHVVHVVLNKDPFPNLEDTRSMLSLAETRMNRKSSSSSSSRISSSSPTALVTQSGPTRSQGSNTRFPQNKSTSACRNFSRGFCSYGERCRFVHANNNNNNNNNNNGSRSARTSNQQVSYTNLGQGPLVDAYTQLLQAHQKLLQQSNSAQQRSRGQATTRGPSSLAHQQLQAHVDSQETALPQAFSTLTLQDFGNAGWNMDTGLFDSSNSTPM